MTEHLLKLLYSWEEILNFIHW